MSSRLKVSLLLTGILFVVAVVVFIFGPVLFASVAYPLPSEYQASVSKWSQQYGVSPNLLCALIFTESGWRPNAHSGAGAIGMTQFVPSTAVSVAHQLGVSPFSTSDLISNPDLAIRFGAYYISQDISRYNGDIKKALIAYNGGNGAVVAYESGAAIRSTVNYANKILSIEKAYDTIYGEWWKTASASSASGAPSPSSSSSSPSTTQFTVKPKIDFTNLNTIPVVDFWKTFLSNQPESQSSGSSNDTLNNFWTNLLPGS